MSKTTKIALNEEELKVILHGMPDGLDLDGVNVSVEPADGSMGDEMGSEDDMDSDELDLGIDDEGDSDIPELDSDMGDDDMEDMDSDMHSDEDDMVDEMDLGIDLDIDDDSGSMSAKLSPMDDSMDDDSDMGMGMDDDMDSGMDDDDMGDMSVDGMDDEDGELEDMDNNEVVEISEVELAEAIKELKKSRLSEGSDSELKTSPHQFDGTSHGPENEEDFGGGSSIGEPFVDIDHLSLSESEDMDEGEELEESDDLDEEEELQESKKELQEKVLSYKRKCASLQRKLDEATLFNVKMEAANRLMSNENLTKNQRLTIVNALDKADTVKEVKKLFATMNEAFSDKKRQGKQISEGVGTKIVGGSSKVQKSGGATILKESLSDPEKEEYSRWGELAGFTK